MSALNRTLLTGRLVNDPEVKFADQKNPVANFRLAVKRRGKKGEKNLADFFNCTAWGGLAKTCGEYLKKGRLVAIEGRLQVKQYKDKSGNNRDWTEVVADSVEMLDFKPLKDKKEELETVDA
jgi:single-strand DNA-binding protein